VDNRYSGGSPHVDDSKLRIHDDTYLSLQREISFPPSGASTNSTVPNFLFQNSARSTYYVLGTDFDANPMSPVFRMPATIGAPPAGTDAGAPLLTYLTGITPPTGGTVLGFTVRDAEYASASDQIVFVSHSPSNAIHVYTPSTDVDHLIPLPLAPTAIALSGDQRYAIVGYDGWMGYVDLTQSAILKMCALPTSVYDLVLAPNGFAYVFPHLNGDYHMYSVNLADCTWTLVNQGLTGTYAKLTAAGTKIYAADSSAYEIDVLPSGLLSYMTVHEFNVPTIDLPLGRLWSRALDASTTELIFGAGAIFEETAMMTLSHVGQLPGVDENHILVDFLRSQSGKVLTILTGDSGSRDGAGAVDGALTIFSAAYASLPAVPLPAFSRDGATLYSHGRLLFERPQGDLDYVVVATDIVDSQTGDRAFGIVRLSPP
jgi:hypothetical protein